MKIIAVNSRTEFMGSVMEHKFAFQAAYEMGVIEFLRSLKVKYGWREFSWTPQAVGTKPDGTQVQLTKVWAFSNPKIGIDIWNRYKNVDITQDCGVMYQTMKDHEEAEAIRRKARSEAFISSAKEIVVLDNNGQPIPLKDYQKSVLKFADLTNGHALCALPPGAGKTLCSLAWIQKIGLNKVLVVSPATVKIVWEKEVEKWLGGKTYIISTTSLLTPEIYNDTKFFIINYEILDKLKKHLSAFKFDVILFDESSRIKSKSAKTTKAAIEISKAINYQLGLNGTPVMNRYDELYTQIQAIRDGYFGTEKDFKEKFCGATLKDYIDEKEVTVKAEDGTDVKIIKQTKKKRWVYDSPQRVEELRELLAAVVIYYTKDEILSELPPKIFNDVPVQVTKEDMAKYREAEENFVEWMNENKPRFDAEGNQIKVTTANILEQINVLRQMTSLMKTKAVLERLQLNQEAEAKSIVFSVYNAPLKELKEQTGEESVLLIGETSMEDRLVAIDSFQDGDKTIFLGGTKSAGVGITLTAASEVLFLDYSWSPTDHWQAADRAHRVGSKHESINITHFYVPGTIDDRMREITASKEKLIKMLFEGGSSTAAGQKVNIANEVVNSYKKSSSSEPF